MLWSSKKLCYFDISVYNAEIDAIILNDAGKCRVGKVMKQPSESKAVSTKGMCENATVHSTGVYFDAVWENYRHLPIALTVKRVMHELHFFSTVWKIKKKQERHFSDKEKRRCLDCP